MKGASWRADLSLVGITFIWGSTFVVVKGALDDASTVLFLALRFTLALAALALALRTRPSRFALKSGALAGTALFAGYLFQTVGLRYTTPSKSAFITTLSIVIVPLLATLVERRAPQPAEVAGVVLATAGMALMTLDLKSLKIGYGDFLTFLCAISFAVHVTLTGHFAPKTGFAGFSLVQIGTAAAFSIAGFWWVEPVFVHWTPRLIATLVVTGLFATALAFSVQTWAQQHTTATRTALIFSLEPVFASATSYVVSREVLSRQAFAGAGLILAGILLVELRQGRKP